MRSNSIKWLLTFLVLFVPYAYSDEGRIPIYATGPITQPGHYFLTRDVTGTITIQASNVTLDLNGFTVIGASWAIRIMAGNTDVRIRNGSLQCTGCFGVYHDDATSPIRIFMENLIISSTIQAVYILGAESVELISSSISDCSTNCVTVDAGGTNNFHGKFIRNTVSNAGSNGFYLNRIKGGEIAENDVSVFGGADPGAQAGIRLEGASTGNLLQHNTIHDGVSLDHGIMLGTDAEKNRLVNNVSSNNSGAGIIVGSAYNSIENNYTGGNGGGGQGPGISVQNSYNLVSGNTVTLNGGGFIGGIVTSGFNNRISNNNVEVNGWFGIEAGGAGNLVENNFLNGHFAGGGIALVPSSNNVYRTNVCLNNACGIGGTFGNIDGGGNLCSLCP